MTDDIKMICHNCVGESFLKAEIQKIGRNHQCSYCKRRRRCYTLEQIAERIEGAFERHYVRTAQEPDSYEEARMRDVESDYEWFRQGEPVVEAIMDAADISEETARDIQQFLEDKHTTRSSWELSEECEFGESSHYEYKDVNSQHWQTEWNDFERSLKTETRFFNSSGVQHLQSIFEGIEDMATLDRRPAIATAGPGKEITGLYRARVFQSDDKLKTALSYPDQQLGTPPAGLAAAGRMNASGISVFYGATDPRLAIAEVRPPVGSQVAVARFDFIREVRLLDLIALNNIATGGSIFDERYSRLLERVVFLRDLSVRIMKPVLPDDAPMEYLPTQAIADYLAADTRLNIDGIIFSSSQVHGSSVNVVLFNKAAKIEKIEHEEGSEVKASTEDWDEDGPRKFYMVTVETPSEENKVSGKITIYPFIDETHVALIKPKATLKVDLKSIKIHIIHAVAFTTEEHNLHWHQHKKIDFSKLRKSDSIQWDWPENKTKTIRDIACPKLL